jgi:predicted aspartyl protease
MRARSAGIQTFVLFLTVVAVAAAADVDRDALWRIAKECETLVKDLYVKDIDQFGRVWFDRGRAGPFAEDRFRQCYQERTRAKQQPTPPVAFGSGSVAASSALQTSVPIEVAEGMILVAVKVNGSRRPAAFILDTGAQSTVLRPEFAKTVGITPPSSAPRVDIMGIEGKRTSVPLVRVRSIQVGDVVVEDLQIPLYNVLPEVPNLAGLLGADFLHHFKFTVDRQGKRLSLAVQPAESAEGPTMGEPSPPVAISCPKGAVWTGKGCIAEGQAKGRPDALASPPEQPGKTVLPSVTVPIWQKGYEWEFRWSSPSGSGTFVRTMVGEEQIAGVPHYVLRSGTRDLLYSKAELAWLMDRVEGKVATRAAPPFRAFAWPLAPGKAWEARYRWENRRQRQTEERVRRLRVEGVERVTVPAGTFEALRLSVKDPTGRLVEEYWYAPEVRWLVKERAYLASGVRERELLGYRLDDARR